MDMKEGVMTMPTTKEASMSVPKLQVELEKYMRKLWEDHVLWTRQAIVSLVAGLPDADASVARLLQNPIDMEKAFALYYGDQTAAAVRDLLKVHLTTAAELVMAAKAGDSAKAADAEKRWYDNADEISGALNSINPNWPKDAMMDMMHDHLKMTKAEAVARLKQDWDLDVKTYDMVHDQILIMADELTEGIVKQFPDKFMA